MRFNAFTVLLLATLALAYAVPTPSVADKKPSALDDSKIEQSETLNADSTDEEKDRAKKSTTTFCVEIRPGSNEPTPCECKKEAERVQVAPQPCLQNIVAPKPPKPTLPPTPPPMPTHKPRPTTLRPKPVPLPVPEESIRPIVPPCGEPQVIVVPSNPFVFFPEHEEPKPAQIVQPHHHHCHKCGQQQRPTPDCTCSSCRAAQNVQYQAEPVMAYDPMTAAIMSERMAYEPYLRSHHNHDHKQYMQQPMTAPGMIMYGGSSVVPKTPLVLQCNPRIMPLGDMSTPIRREDAGEHDVVADDIRELSENGLRSNPVITLHPGLQSQVTQLHHDVFQTPYYSMNSGYSHYSVPQTGGVYINAYPQIHGSPTFREIQPQMLNGMADEGVDPTYGVPQSSYETVGAAAENGVSLQSDYSTASEADDLMRTSMPTKRGVQSAEQTSVTKEVEAVSKAPETSRRDDDTSVKTDAEST